MMNKSLKILMIPFPGVDLEKLSHSVKAQGEFQVFEIGGIDLWVSKIEEQSLSIHLAPYEQMTGAQRNLLLRDCHGVILCIPDEAQRAQTSADFFAKIVVECRNVQIDLRNHPLLLHYLSPDVSRFEESVFLSAFGISEGMLSSVVSPSESKGIVRDSLLKLLEQDLSLKSKTDSRKKKA